MFSVIRNIWDSFWEIFIVLTFCVCAQDTYVIIRESALKKTAKGIPPIMKFNDKLWGRK